jgi:hypothetical protein
MGFDSNLVRTAKKAWRQPFLDGLPSSAKHETDGAAEEINLTAISDVASVVHTTGLPQL